MRKMVEKSLLYDDPHEKIAYKPSATATVAERIALPYAAQSLDLLYK